MKTNPAARIAIYQRVALPVQENPGDYTKAPFLAYLIVALNGSVCCDLCESNLKIAISMEKRTLKLPIWRFG
jgi:hypothetical protein